MTRQRHRWSLRRRLARWRPALRLRLGRIAQRFSARIGRSDRSGELVGRFCPAPFQQVDLEESGACYTCCSSWLPTPMGNVRHSPFPALWNGPVMRKIRESIYDGSFRYCRADRCPHIQSGTLPSLEEGEAHPAYGTAVRERRTELPALPSVVNLVNDRSCNLACPSCRTC